MRSNSGSTIQILVIATMQPDEVAGGDTIEALGRTPGRTRLMHWAAMPSDPFAPRAQRLGLSTGPVLVSGAIPTR